MTAVLLDIGGAIVPVNGSRPVAALVDGNSVATIVTSSASGGNVPTGLEIRTLLRADAAALSAAFAAIGWSKPVEQFVRYAADADAGTRANWIAVVDGAVAGYATLNRDPDYPSIAGRGIPEIQDLNVLPRFRRRGIASAMLDLAEAVAAEHSDMVAIGVGLHPGYNAAQVLYAKRGYVPDGRGVTYGHRFVQEGETVPFDDSLVLHLTKEIGS